jgi:hypothetical protein
MPRRLRLSLRFPITDVKRWASGYTYGGDSELAEKIGRPVEAQRYATREQFLELARWKSPRIVPKCAQNDAAFVEEVTGRALQSKNERFKVESLRLLNGVDWPVASVVLHFCQGYQYPILDYRALWSLRVHPAPRYTYALWEQYTRVTRELAAAAKVDMRTLDRALWQYSKERQRA